MFQYLLAVCLISSALGNEAQSGRIVGGRQAGRGQFPFQGSLRNLKNSHFCGAAIIGDRWLLTAAHCTIGNLPYQLRVVVGSVDRTAGGVSYNLAQIIEHPDFNELTLDNDLALLKTVYPIEMSFFVQPVVLSGNVIPAGIIATASGWGQTFVGSGLATMLQFMEVRTLNNYECKLRHGLQNREKVHTTSLCTFSRSGQGTCMGDSGSPLVANSELVGIVSWGVPCAAGKPDVYTSVPAHRAWIKYTTGI
ncbi:chymotrypsin-2-like [Topomyia yanbarensis]|uniref:chymotrypsin-2-like n=1 Tax=Topomyia yanbarensis TaxID=2498891 RepID=UPI00273BDC70|nr:chymotrypsin-2-like [Topomyia yanbarensis]